MRSSQVCARLVHAVLMPCSCRARPSLFTQLIMAKWVEPHVDTSAWEYYDLSCKSRDDTEDQVLHDAVAAGARVKAIFKEPTVTPTEVQKKALGLKKAWCATRSPQLARLAARGLAARKACIPPLRSCRRPRDFCAASARAVTGARPTVRCAADGTASPSAGTRSTSTAWSSATSGRCSSNGMRSVASMAPDGRRSELGR